MGPGLLPPQTLPPDTQLFTLETGQQADQVTAPDILDMEFTGHTGDQRGQVLGGEWAQVNTTQLKYLQRAKQAVVSQAGAA